MKFSTNGIITKARIEIIPLIDVVFLVLVTFVYASMFMTQKTGIVVDLPVASESETQIAKVLTITITADGTLFLDKESILLENLGNILSIAKTSSDKDITLFVVADKKAQLDILVQVMNITRQVGIKSLNIATERITK